MWCGAVREPGHRQAGSILPPPLGAGQSLRCWNQRAAGFSEGIMLVFFQFVISPSVTVVCGTCSLGVRFPEPPPGQALCRAHFTGEETGPGESPVKGTSQQVQLCPSSFDSRNY